MISLVCVQCIQPVAGVDPRIFNREAQHFLRRKMAVLTLPGPPHTVWQPVCAKIMGMPHVSAKIRGSPCWGCPT